MGEAAKVYLDPVNAAPSIAWRVRAIAQHAAYIRAVMARYDGLKSLDAELARLGVKGAVDAITAAEPADEPDGKGE